MGPGGSQALDRLSGAFFAVDADWRFTALNEQCRQLVCEAAGREATVIELVGEHLWESIPALRDTRFAERVREAVATGEPVTFQATIAPLDAWFEVRVYPDEPGCSVYLRDVTERREREYELEQYRTLLEAASDVIVTIDTDSVVRAVNPAVEAVFGYEPDELVGEPLTKLMTGADREQHLDGIASYLETGERNLDWDYVELTGRTADGAPVPLAVSFSETTVDGERYFTGIVRDISERKEREHELERRELVLAEVYQVTSNKDATLEEKVDTLLEIGRAELGTDYGALSRVEGDDYVFEVTHDPEGETQPGDVVPLAETNCERAIVTEQTLVLEDIGVDAPDLAERAGFTEQGISCYLGTPVVVDGEVYGTFCFYDRDARREPFTDWEVTLVELMGNWVSYEQERVRREAELRRERNRLQGFAGVVTHDLRNPLAIASGRLELAREERDGEHLAAAADALTRMDEIIEDVLTLAKGDRADLELAPVGLHAVAEAAWATVDHDGAELVLGDDGTIDCDRSRVRRLLENLLGNAVGHCGDGVVVRVGALPDGFYVADDGPGIPRADRERVFEPGYSSRDDGTGFGLHIVRTIADAHDWSVAVTDSEDGGTRFEIRGADVTE